MGIWYGGMERRFYKTINKQNFTKMRVTTAKYGDVYIRWQYDDKMNPSITKAFLERKIGEKNKEVIKEVTDDSRYTNSNLAQKIITEDLN